MLEVQNNKKSKSIKNPIWDGIGTRMYSVMSTKLESDQPAYRFIYNLVCRYVKTSLRSKVEDLKILDFGCHNGASTFIYESFAEAGAKVIGIDSNPVAIAEAQIKYSDYSRIEFFNCSRIEQIPLGGFNVVLATFVHPTIGSKKELEEIFIKINNSMARKGIFILLGLNPGSFGGKYLSYNHKLDYGAYKDGLPFRNSLNLSDGSSLSFDDFCWTDKTMLNLLKRSGFGNQQVINLSKDLKGDEGALFCKALEEIEAARGSSKWLDEWGREGKKCSGLFNVYLGFKP